MSPDQSTHIFLCSYCEQPIKFRDEQEGRRIRCPKCKKTVWVHENRSETIHHKLSSTWMYERPKLLGLLGNKMIGPISDTEFLELMMTGEIDRDFLVRSPELTQNQDILAGRLNLSIIREMCSQRTAEDQRRQNVLAREDLRASRNREILLQGIKQAISDGNLSLNERTQLYAFASKVGIAESEVEDILKRESSIMLKQAVEEAVADGFFDDQEQENLSRLAIGLGLTLEFTKDQKFRLTLARTAWSLLQRLRANGLQQTIEYCGAEVFEIFSLKRPAGIALGNDHYLKLVATGEVKRIEKSLLIDGPLVAKKYALSSIMNVQWFADGLFLKRSSGKSLFVRPLKLGLDWHQFAMAMKVLTTGEPVVGTLPEEHFIPAADVVAADLADDNAQAEDLPSDVDQPAGDWEPSNRIPRFTFRVVGESYDNRSLDLNRLSIGEKVFLIREPHNPYDSNAVMVVNRQRRMLGYLKREVSAWFSPILDKGREFDCEVKQRTASGGILIAVFD